VERDGHIASARARRRQVSKMASRDSQSSREMSLCIKIKHQSSSAPHFPLSVALSTNKSLLIRVSVGDDKTRFIDLSLKEIRNQEEIEFSHK